MTFTDFKNLPASSKIILCEFDVPAGPSNFDIFLNYEAGIWVCAITPGVVEITGSDAEVGYYTNQNTTIYYDITGFIVDSVNEYTKVFSLEELREQEGGFWYDKDGVSIGCPAVLVHFTDYEEPLNKLIQLKQVYGFCDKIDSINGAYFNDTYYEPRIDSVPSISKSKDPLFYGVIRFQGGSVTFNNADGFFDNFKDLNLYRTPATIKFGFDGLDYDNFRTVFQGYVESYDYDFEKFSVKLQDKRKGLTNKIPPNVFTRADWPDISDDNVNKPKPISYGNVRNAPLVCLNEKDETPPAHYVYFLGDTEFYPITSVSAVYCNDELLSASNYHIDLNSGTINIDSGVVADNITEVSADLCHVPIYNSLAIVKDIMMNYASVPFNNTTYFLAEWNQAQSEGRNAAIYINEADEIIKVIEKLMDASDAIFLVKDDGRYSARVYSPDRAAAATIENDEWMDTPSISLDESQFLSSVNVKYNKNWKSGNYNNYLNETYKADTIIKYKGEQEKEFETILETAAGAQEKSESIMFFSRDIKEIVKRKVKTQHIDLEVMDFVEALPHKRINAGTVNQIWEVLGITKNLTSAEIELTLRFVKTFVPVEPTLYQTGILWNDYLFGDKVLEVAYE